MSEAEYRIRPSARLISTIGKDLVKDKFAAVVELVKNAYDADSSDVKIRFSYQELEKVLTISIADSGHGMNIDTVVNKWLVPATSDKLDRKISYKGRSLQGRKGIGRFAAAALGSAIYLNTKSDNYDEVSLLLDLDEFSRDKFLEDVPIIVEETKSNKKSGTYLEIISRDVTLTELEDSWGEKQRSNLSLELSKLLAPTEVSKRSKDLGYANSDDKFNIYVEYIGFPEVDSNTLEIKPFGIVDLYDYRISGNIDSEGNAEFEYSNQNIINFPVQKLKKKILLDSKELQKYPGNINFDLRVFDRDPDSITNLIERGLIDPISEEKIGKAKAKKILDSYYGVSIFRGNFRIRPYGNKDYDWLQRDSLRVNTPSLRIGHNQIIGFVGIQSEEYSHLEEKSARDGLIENKYYNGLIHLINSVLLHLEENRFSYREKSFKGGRKPKNVNDQIEDLFNFTSVYTSVNKRIRELNFDKSSENSVIEIVENEIKKEQEKKSKEYKKVRDTIALYQGQATLGKITHIVLHDGRKHIKVINEVPPRLLKWIKSLASNFDQDVYDKVVNRSELLMNSSKSLSILFKKIEPLSVSRRPNRKDINLLSEISSIVNIFESDILNEKISVDLDIPEDISIFGTNFDLATIFSNLIENSLYWLSISESKTKRILIEASYSSGEIELIFSDTGPGFQGSDLNLMFEPGFSMKPGGTGLGLALIGECVTRLNGNIKAASSDDGACFIMNFKRNL